MPMDRNFAVIVILVVVFAALIALAANLVWKATDRREKRLQQEAADRGREVVERALTRTPPHKSERRGSLSPLHAAPYGRPNLQEVKKDGPTNARIGRVLRDRNRHTEARIIGVDPARNSADDMLATGLLLYAATSGSSRASESSRGGESYPLGIEATPSPVVEPTRRTLDDFPSSGTYTPHAEPDTRPTFSSSYSSSDSYDSSSSSYDSSSSSSSSY